MVFWGFNRKESKYDIRDFRSFNYRGKWQKKFIDDYIQKLVNYYDRDSVYSAMASYKEEHLPKFLYKFYRPSANSLINIENDLLHLSSPAKFNDPFDSYICIEEDTFIKKILLRELKNRKLVSENEVPDKISEKEYWRIFHSDSSNKKLAKRTIMSTKDCFFKACLEVCNGKNDEFRNIVNSIKVEALRECRNKIKHLRNVSYSITCFSNFTDEEELNMNTTMWSHYADNHKGFCVRYPVSFDSLKYKNLILCGLFPVIYTSKVPKVSPQELIKAQVFNGALEVNQKIQRTVLKSLITKCKFWSYEKEWRLIVSQKDEHALLNGTIPFVQPASIYMGCRIDKNLKNHLVKFAEKNNIKIYQAEQLNERFELDFSEISVGCLKEEYFYEKLYKYNRMDNQKEREYLTNKLYKNDEKV